MVAHFPWGKQSKNVVHCIGAKKVINLSNLLHKYCVKPQLARCVNEDLKTLKLNQSYESSFPFNLSCLSLTNLPECT